MRRATAFFIALTFSAGLAAAGAEPRRAPTIRATSLGVAVREPTIVSSSTTTTEPPTTTTEPPTTTTEPPTTTTFLAGGPDDRSGPILCPGLAHPAHHRPCPTKTTTATTVASAPATRAPSAPGVALGPSSTSVLLACLRQYESTDGVDPNLYQFDSGTWLAAWNAAVDQGLIDPTKVAFTSASNAARWVQDAAAQAWINAGHLRQAWLAQAGRCF